MVNPAQFAFFLLVALVIPSALWKGGAPERVGASIILAMWGLQAGGEHFLPSGFVAVDPFSLLSDLIGFVGFGYLAVEARRIWPLWAASLQILSLSAHFARWADLSIHPMVYALMRGTPTFGAMIAIFIGTVLHRTRLQGRGYDPSWQNWSRGAAGSSRSRRPF
ncbi:hypothetical protein [Novosphingobium mangrovi (ex Huang et al. 2023)]|uniref:Uncharacterized protein n=1 Tax=Novosphingobium mangrovi (ex Huang et al. 2023) TaxID=2976432 RepID=A0ABT2I213_9SPHN|nr:hypothetical protein [Novosphingobium mangrovi (ex Huang et al. 2023)]MCT2398846.1 hypothetical protein [Novosphingobium mangrovi (ex Huang et al. 2023)]